MDIPKGAAINTLVSIQPLGVSGASQNPTQAPHPFNDLHNGTLVEGFVIRRDAQNNPVLRTSVGDVLINTTIFLKTGAEVVLRVDNTQPSHARLITINGLTPELFQNTQKLSASPNDALSGTPLPQAGNAASGIPKPVQVAGVILQIASDNGVSPQLLSSAIKALGLSDQRLRATSSANASNALSIIIKTVEFVSEENADNLPATQNNTTRNSPTLKNQPVLQRLDFNQSEIGGLANANKQTQTIQAEIARAAQSTLPTIDDVVFAISSQEAAKTTSTSVSQPQPIRTAATTLAATVNASDTATDPEITQIFDALKAKSSPIFSPTFPASVHTAASTIIDAADVLVPNNIAITNTKTIAVVTLNQNISSNPQIPITGAQHVAQGSQTTPILALAPESRVSPTINVASVNNTLQAPVTSSTASAIHQPVIKAYGANAIVIAPDKSVQVEALVIGHESGGDTVVQTPLGVIKLFSKNPLPIGSVVTLSITPQTYALSAESLALTLPHDIQEFTHLARDWDALSDTLLAVRAGNANAFMHITQDILPNTGKNLTHGMLFFLSALKTGDVRNWLGNKISDNTDSKSPEIFRRLNAEFSGLQQVSIDTTQQGWMSTIIPIMHDQTLHQARLFIRHEDEKESDAGKRSGGNRFIIEVDLTQLGEMQFDGFVTKESGRHQFDMMVRSTRALPLDMQQDIRAIYANAGAVAGFTGMLQFQTNPDSFMRPLSTMQRNDGSGIIA